MADSRGAGVIERVSPKEPFGKSAREAALVLTGEMFERHIGTLRLRQYVVTAAGGHANLGSTLGDYVVAFALPDR